MKQTEPLIRVCILANSARYIANFRLNLMKTLRAEGYDVIAMSPYGEEVSRITDAGFRHICFPLAPSGTQVWQEVQTIFTLRQSLKQNSVGAVLSSTPKGNIYTAIANMGTTRSQIANVSGLGSTYIRRSFISRIVSWLYYVTFRRINYVFFENYSDYDKFFRHGWINPQLASVIPGLGVDLMRFCPCPRPKSAEGAVRFLMISRLIGDKGVREYVAAARRVRALHPKAQFHLLGDSAAENPTNIPSSELEMWKSSGDIFHHEHADDVRPFIADSHCIVLPSYREGMSRTLLEGGAMGKALIASDVPGCREAIDDEHSGYLCQPRNAASLADAMVKFLALDIKERELMGERSRIKILNHFSEDIVLKKYCEILKNLI
jgi:glycosyltransferase involved in cell wall biosynthesis